MTNAKLQALCEQLADAAAVEMAGREDSLDFLRRNEQRLRANARRRAKRAAERNARR